MTIEIYSDVACPWCYVGKRRFNRALQAMPDPDRFEVVFRPYQLDPTLPDEAYPLRGHLERKFGPRVDAILQHTTATARQEGIELRFDRALASNTLRAHRLMRLALLEYSPETQQTLAESLFKAHFTDGLDVSDATVLTELAVAAGMDSDRVGSYLASDEGLREVKDEIMHAQRLGIRAVPTFLFDGKYAVQGAQPTSTFVEVLEELVREGENAVEVEDDTACADDSCAVG